MYPTGGSLLIGVCIALYFAVILGVVVILRKQRTTRWPFKNDDKLLRGPGEELRRQMSEFDLTFLRETVGGIVGGIVVWLVIAQFCTRASGQSSAQAAGWGAIGLLLVYGYSAYRVSRLWHQRQNQILGWYGERYVAECLEPAKLRGWRVFHDVPFGSNGAKFNLDHVVVGAGGVFVVETKTRRKGNARPGRKDNQVFFDGRQLDWPWGSDSHGLEQAERNAIHLTKWIQSETNERVHVTPLLALPGWWLENRPGKDARLCQVVNPKWLPGLFDRQKPTLSPNQVEFISAKLDVRCRDVED